MNLLMAQCSSGPSNVYLAAQAITGTNYVSPVTGCFIRRIMSSVRTAGGQVFVYYADDANGSNAHVIYNISNANAYNQIDVCNLWIPVPAGKYILTYSVSSIHDTTFTIAENATSTDITLVAASVTGYAPLKANGIPYQGPGTVKRVISMNTALNSVGYLYIADDLSGSNASVLRGYSGNALYTIFDSNEDCMAIPASKYLLARAEVGSFSCAVTVGA